MTLSRTAESATNPVEQITIAHHQGIASLNEVTAKQFGVNAECHPHVAAAASHIQAATRITNVADLRYFTLHDLQEVKINLHLALELLEVLKRAANLTLQKS